MKLACIDVGSNAIRLQVVRVIEEEEMISFQKLQYIRFPLRLGKDAFSAGQLTGETIDRFNKLMRTFKLLIELYEVDGYIGVATSAMREAENGWSVVQQVATYYDLKIAIISGDEEAEILSNAIVPYLQSDKNYVHIDVGGGSTELNIYHNRERTISHSFNMGTVRKLSPADKKATFKEMARWVKENRPNKRTTIGIGTGGNINQLFKIANRTTNISMTLTELLGIRAYLNEYTYDQRVQLLKLNEDRADVIIPAAEIYIQVLKSIGSDEIMVPRVGLKDGLLYTLYKTKVEGRTRAFQFLDAFE